MMIMKRNKKQRRNEKKDTKQEVSRHERWIKIEEDDKKDKLRQLEFGQETTSCCQFE